MRQDRSNPGQGRSLDRYDRAAAAATVLLAALALCGGSGAAAAEAVTLEYNERPPYLITRSTELAGLTGAPAVAAFRAAHVPFALRLASAERQLADLQSSQHSCAVGWFKTAEREQYAKFTRPIYRDRAQIALTQSGNPLISKGPIAIEALLSRPEPILLTKQGYSYGAKLDELIARLHPRSTRTFEENVQMIRVLDKGRADYMFIAPEEAAGAIAASGVAPARLRKVTIDNAPPGEYRYILCSRAVEDGIIEKLDKVLPAVK